MDKSYTEVEQAMRHPDVLRNVIKKDGGIGGGAAYSPNNPPPYPVTSVNGQTGDVTVSGISFLDVYPVGSVYISTSSVNPGTLFGGTWALIGQDRFLVGAGTTYTLGETGGNYKHNHTTGNCTLTIQQIPSHTHYIYGGDGDVPDWFGGSGNTYGIQARTKSAYDRLQYVGGGQAHNHGNTGETNHIPPYLAVNMWERTA